MSGYEQEEDQPGLDDGERALRDAEQERHHEQDDADDDVAPGPPDEDEGGE